LPWEKPEVAGSQTWAIGVLTDLGDAMVEWAGALMQIS